MWLPVFFEGDKGQQQQQPRDDALGVIEGMKTIGDGLAVRGAELAEFGRDYDLQFARYVIGYSPRVRTPIAASAELECAVAYFDIVLVN